MVDSVDSAYEAMLENLDAAHKHTLTNISNAYNAEERINNLRNNLRDAEIEDIENGGKNYQTSVYYMDLRISKEPSLSANNSHKVSLEITFRSQCGR